MPTLALAHHLDHAVDLLLDGQPLLRYVYQPTTVQWETPKPYFHPLRTRAGRVVTIHRPWDHVWHHGLAMTITVLSGQNFWGGNTFTTDRGYVALPNTGRQQHVAWDDLALTGNQAALAHRLHWITMAGETWLAEQRRWGVALGPGDAAYTLTFESQLTNVAGRPLVCGSPTTEGRPNAGYGGLFWRGPRDFAGGQVLLGDGRRGQDAGMGSATPWLAYVGRHDEVDASSTLVFVDDPRNARYPAKWFVRSEPFAAVSFAEWFDQEQTLAPGEVLTLRHKLIVADGAWTAEQVAAAV
ncbi:MAG: PmoA family protein [Fimbriimonadaceae bacterium]|nr:PmoA family protein [Fimbriimonadaceae bacterium]